MSRTQAEPLNSLLLTSTFVYSAASMKLPICSMAIS